MWRQSLVACDENEEALQDQLCRHASSAFSLFVNFARWVLWIQSSCLDAKQSSSSLVPLASIKIATQRSCFTRCPKRITVSATT